MLSFKCGVPELSSRSSAAHLKPGNWSASWSMRFLNMLCPSAIFISFFVQIGRKNFLCVEVNKDV